MFASLARALLGYALRLFYRLQLSSPLPEGEGPLILVGTHPNAHLDPLVLSVLQRRRLTVYLKPAAFARPWTGWLVGLMGARPRSGVWIDDAVDELLRHRAILVFPEGLATQPLKVGDLRASVARIALRAFARGAPVRIVPIGISWAHRLRFRSLVRVEPGESVYAEDHAEYREEEGSDSYRSLIRALVKKLETTTLHLEQWEDSPIIRTAEQIHALDPDGLLRDPDRRRLFARGLRLFRAEDPAGYAEVQDALLTFRRRALLARFDPRENRVELQSGISGFFFGTLLTVGLGFPLMAVGLVVFWLPYQLLRWATVSAGPRPDALDALKLLPALLAGFAMWALIVSLFFERFGPVGAVLGLAAAPALAFFTRYLRARTESLLDDLWLALAITDREGIKDQLAEQARTLSLQLARVLDHLERQPEPAPRVSTGTEVPPND